MTNLAALCAARPGLTSLPGSALRPGYIIRAHGYRWRVTSVRYDLRGNMGSNARPHPRYCVAAEPADADTAASLPRVYHKMSMGLSTHLDWYVEI